MDLHRRVHAAGGGAADQQRQFEALPLHLRRHMAHLVERGRDQAGQADDVGLDGARGFQNLRRRHHDAEIDDLVIVALEHDADDVLADVVHVALDRRHHDLAVRRSVRAAVLLLLHVGHQVSDRLLHHPRRLHHLRQKHFARAEQVADDVHAVHQRAFDDVQRLGGGKARLLDVGLDEIGDAVHQRMRQPLLDRLVAPGEIDFARRLPGAAELLGQRQQPLGGIGAAVEHHVLASLAQFGIEIVIDRDLAGIDDAHVHAGLNRVIQEHRMHGLAHALIAAERERQIGDAAGDVHVRQILPDPARRLDEIDAVIVVLLHAGGDGEDVGIEDDVLRREADLVHQNVVGALGDRAFALERVGLAFFVERHHHHRSAVAAHDFGVLDEGLPRLLSSRSN